MGEPTDDLPYAPLAACPDGAVLGLTARPLSGISGSGILVDSSMLLVHDGNGAFRDSLVRTRFMQRWSRSSGNRNLVLTPPLTVNPHYVTAGARVCMVDADVLDVRCYSRTGRPLMSVRAALPERPVTQAIIDSFLVARTGQPLDAARRSVYAEIGFPNRLPAYMDLVAAENGQLWVALYRAPGDTAVEWLQFAEDGRLRARVAVPAALRLMAITPDAAFGIARDSLGVETVVRHRLPQPVVRCPA